MISRDGVPRIEGGFEPLMVRAQRMQRGYGAVPLLLMPVLEGSDVLEVPPGVEFTDVANNLHGDVNIAYAFPAARAAVALSLAYAAGASAPNEGQNAGAYVRRGTSGRAEVYPVTNRPLHTIPDVGKLCVVTSVGWRPEPCDGEKRYPSLSPLRYVHPEGAPSIRLVAWGTTAIRDLGNTPFVLVDDPKTWRPDQNSSPTV